MREISEFLSNRDMTVHHQPVEYEISKVWNISDLISNQNNLSFPSQTQSEKRFINALDEKKFQEFLEILNSVDATSTLFIFFESHTKENPSFLSLLFESNLFSLLVIDDDHLELLLKSVFLLKLSFVQSMNVFSMLYGMLEG